MGKQRRDTAQLLADVLDCIELYDGEIATRAIAKELGVTPAAVSQALPQFIPTGFLVKKRKGRVCFYSKGKRCK